MLLCLFSVSQYETVSRYAWICAEQMSSFLCVVIVTLSAYEDVCMCGGGFEMSCMCRLKSVGESAEPCELR